VSGIKPEPRDSRTVLRKGKLLRSSIRDHIPFLRSSLKLNNYSLVFESLKLSYQTLPEIFVLDGALFLLHLTVPNPYRNLLSSRLNHIFPISSDDERVKSFTGLESETQGGDGSPESCAVARLDAVVVKRPLLFGAAQCNEAIIRSTESVPESPSSFRVWMLVVEVGIIGEDEACTAIIWEGGLSNIYVAYRAGEYILRRRAWARRENLSRSGRT